MAPQPGFGCILGIIEMSRRSAHRRSPRCVAHHAATVIARYPVVTLRELMATISHSSRFAALRYQHSAAERSRAIADYLDGVISAARMAPGA